MAERCDHKFVDTNYCLKCGALAAELSGDQRSSRTQATRVGHLRLANGELVTVELAPAVAVPAAYPHRRRRPHRRFACEPLRGGWVIGWMIDGVRVDQRPQLRVEANAPLVLRADADHVVAIFALSDDQPPCLLQLDGETHGEQIGGALLSGGRR